MWTQHVNFVLLLIFALVHFSASTDGSTCSIQLDHEKKDKSTLITKIQHVEQLNTEISQELNTQTTKLNIATQELDLCHAAGQNERALVESGLCDNLRELQGTSELGNICNSEQEQDTEFLLVTLTNTVNKIKHELAQYSPKTTSDKSTITIDELIQNWKLLADKEAMETANLISEFKSFHETCLSMLSQSNIDKSKLVEKIELVLNNAIRDKQACEIAKIHAEVKNDVLQSQLDKANKNDEKYKEEIKSLQHDKAQAEQKAFVSNFLLEHFKNKNSELRKTEQDNEIKKLLEECSSNLGNCNLEKKNFTLLNAQLIKDKLLVENDLEICKNEIVIEKVISDKITKDLKNLKTETSNKLDKNMKLLEECNETSRILKKENDDFKLSLSRTTTMAPITELIVKTTPVPKKDWSWVTADPLKTLAYIQNKQYVFVKKAVPYFTAVNECLNIGMNLMTIETVAELNAIVAWIINGNHIHLPIPRSYGVVWANGKLINNIWYWCHLDKTNKNCDTASKKAMKANGSGLWLAGEPNGNTNPPSDYITINMQPTHGRLDPTNRQQSGINDCYHTYPAFYMCEQGDE